MQALQEAFAIDTAEREARHRAELQAQHQSYLADVQAREDRHRAELQQIQQTYGADVAGREERHAAQVRGLQQALDDTRAQLGEAVPARDRESQARAAAESEISSLRSELTHHREEIATQNAELQARRAEIAGLTDRVTELERALAAANAESEMWSEQFRSTEAELRQVIADAEHAAAQAAREIDEAIHRTESTEERRQRLAEQAAAHEAASQQLRNTIAEQRAERERLTADRDEARQRIAELESQIRNGSYDADRAADNAARAADDAARALEAAQERAAQLAERSAEHESTTEELRQTVADLREELSRTAEEQHRLTRERDAARRRAEELEADLSLAPRRPAAEPADEPEPAPIRATSPSRFEPAVEPLAATKTEDASALFPEEAAVVVETSPDHPVSVAAEIDLAPWQREAFDAWVGAGRRGVIESVSGAHEERLAYWAIGHAVDEGMKVLVVVPSVEQVSKWYADLRDALPINRVGKRNGGKDPQLGACDVVVTTAAAAAKESTFATPYRGLLVAVDAHACATPELSHALDVGFAWRLGLSPCLERADDGVAKYLDPYFGGVSHLLGYDRALAEGAIADFDVALVAVRLNDIEQAEYDTCAKQAADYEAQLAGGGRNASRGYEKARAKMFEIVTNTTARDAVLRALAARLRDTEQALVFAPTEAAAVHAAKVFEGQGCPTMRMETGSDRARRGDRSGDEDGDVYLIAGPAQAHPGLAVVIGDSRNERQLIQRLGHVVAEGSEGRRCRLVVVYIEGTVEDVESQRSASVNKVTSYASKVERFAATETDRLIDFIGATPRFAAARESAPTPA